MDLLNISSLVVQLVLMLLWKRPLDLQSPGIKSYRGCLTSDIKRVTLYVLASVSPDEH